MYAIRSYYVHVFIKFKYSHRRISLGICSKIGTCKIYITGRTFRCLDCPGEYLVISTWNSLDDWNRWLQSEQRMALQKQVDDLLGEITQYRIYESLVGGIIPQFQAVAE